MTSLTEYIEDLLLDTLGPRIEPWEAAELAELIVAHITGE